MPHPDAPNASFALLDDNLSENGESYLYEQPQRYIIAWTKDDVIAALNDLEDTRRSGSHVVGYAAYEAAAAFGFTVQESRLDHSPAPQKPLIFFAVFASRTVLNNADVEAFLHTRFGPHDPFLFANERRVSDSEYLSGIETIKTHLKNGDTYQVNYTHHQSFEVGGCSVRLYHQLRRRQPTKYGAFLHFPDQNIEILSRSPELFFEKTNQHIQTRPMKGTAPRFPSDPDRDSQSKYDLRHDAKQTSENVMIVDLLRNDLGRIAKPNSVSVDALFSIESFATVHQMTSSVSAVIDPDLPVLDIFTAVFPCGSITGAPKKRTCEIISEIETQPRGVYTGAIGYITPENQMCFSVPIRTIEFTNPAHSRHAQMGLGSGIVYDSVAQSELDECTLKGQFLFQHPAPFKVLDCFYHDPIDGSRNKDRHLERLLSSCDALTFPYSRDTLLQSIQEAVARATGPSKVRVLISQSGKIDVECAPLVAFSGEVAHVFFSPIATDRLDPVYQHKTTNRALYDAAFTFYRQKLGAYDVIFTNQDEHITESCHHNLFAYFGDTIVTPPLACGVLNGIGRQTYMEKHAAHCVEDTLTIEQLYTASKVVLVSSIRGEIPVHLPEKTQLYGPHKAFEESFLATASGVTP